MTGHNYNYSKVKLAGSTHINRQSIAMTIDRFQHTLMIFIYIQIIDKVVIQLSLKQISPMSW